MGRMASSGLCLVANLLLAVFVIFCPQVKCIEKVDGMWGQWGNWTDCSESCGGGNQTRVRLCDSPAPAQGGDDCPSNSSYVETTVMENGTSNQQEQNIKTCNEQPCPIH